MGLCSQIEYARAGSSKRLTCDLKILVFGARFTIELATATVLQIKIVVEFQFPNP
jgi:hypothetical protein